MIRVRDLTGKYGYGHGPGAVTARPAAAPGGRLIMMMTGPGPGGLSRADRDSRHGRRGGLRVTSPSVAA
jgi:hypothetical protein